MMYYLSATSILLEDFGHHVQTVGERLNGDPGHRETAPSYGFSTIIVVLVVSVGLD